MISREQVVPFVRAASLAAHYGDFHRDVHRVATSGWKQPGRRFGPIPLGPDTPKANKVTDSDGNPRIAALSADQRIWRYKEAAGRMPSAPAMPLLETAEDEYDARQHARNLGVTMRQRRRIVHKANHATGKIRPTGTGKGEHARKIVSQAQVAGQKIVVIDPKGSEW